MKIIFVSILAESLCYFSPITCNNIKEKLQWKWVNWRYPDESAQVDKACRQNKAAIWEINNLVVNDELKDVKENLLRGTELVKQFCSERVAVVQNQKIAPDPEVEKYLRRGQHEFMLGWKMQERQLDRLKIVVACKGIGQLLQDIPDIPQDVMSKKLLQEVHASTLFCQGQGRNGQSVNNLLATYNSLRNEVDKLQKQSKETHE